MSASRTAASSPVASGRGTRVDDLCNYIQQSRDEEDVRLLCDFARIFFAKVPRQLLVERSVEDLAALTRGAFRFLRSSRANEVHVQILNPEEEGWTAPVTIIRAKVGDRPFIVDTIREYLSAEDIAIQHYVYPVVHVVQDAAGELAELGEGGRGTPEALVHCEVSRIPDPERQAAIQAEIERRLRDVVAVTSDFGLMLEALDSTLGVAEEYARRFADRAAEFNEIAEFLRWLREENFVFFGFRSYDIIGEGEDRVLRVEPGSGLGILHDEERSTYATGISISGMSEQLLRRVTGGPPLIISKTNAESTVHRRARMDYIGVKKLDAEGHIVGECRFLGLFTSKAYTEHAEDIPILRTKLRKILEESGAAIGSHDYKEIITIFNSMPKEDLFQASVAELEDEVQTILSLLFSDEVRVTLRPDPLGRGMTVMVILPRGKFSGEVRQRIQEALRERLQGVVLNYHLAMSAGDQARLHFYLSAPSEAMATADPREIERDITRIIRTWEDRLLDALAEQYEGAAAQRLARRYGTALSEEYRAAFLPEAAIHDIAQFERMQRDDLDVAIELREPRGRGRAEAFRGATALKLYLRGEQLVLSDFMPMLDHAGIKVIEVVPFSVSEPGLPDSMIYSFAVRTPEGGPIPIEKATILSEMLMAVRRGDAANDVFNALVLAAGLHWREVDVLRAYSNYAFQIGALPTRFSPARALARHPGVARLLIELFRAKFDPESHDPAAVRRLTSALADALDEVTTLADDRAFRRLIGLIEATMRTNYFRHGGAYPTSRSGGVPYVSIKIRCADIDETRRSRLLYEIFVHSSRMEGIHLRGAPVSRGGIRWSDRPDDFRTEVLGLVQTQVVKNAVIVPGGSKGGFITKRAFADRDEMMAEAAEQYRTLIRGMLDITDNIADGQVAPPRGVVRYDGDDPYLVVAADKGTAHLSDTANAVAAEYDFWLGDAFASGGSYGYDHKKEGITARGAWECVRRHFREMGKDIQTEPFTVVGIGDMSGDVFGNGMLLSRHIRLLAAFDHRHIFLDPDPDPETSYRERERLFLLPRSSWDDYDRSLLSPGGMIVPRSSKEVPVTPEVRAALGIEDAAAKLDGEALIRTVLRAPAELLWNGGIGTYVKDAEETHAEAGDAANDPVRIDAGELRCRVVGEGGNLGLTQPARITYALGGGRINTDALDNSAGVDMSDHEVNLKILLGRLVGEGVMTFDERNQLLGAMTDAVSALVLGNNFSQSLAVSLDWKRSQDALDDFAALISAFERERMLERGSEGIPSSDTIQERASSRIGLTRPTLCVLLAYAKLHAKSHLLASPLPDDPATEPYLGKYFPPAAVRAAGAERLTGHRLRREIVATELVNDLIDLMGASFLHRVARDTGSEISQVVRAWLIASHVCGAAEIRADMARMETEFPASTVYRWYFGLARVLERTTLWALANVAPDVPALAVIDEHSDGLARLRGDFANVVAGEDRVLFLERMEELQGLGVTETLARRLITLRFLPQLLNILRIAQEEGGVDPVETARAYYLVSEQFGSAQLRQALRNAAHDDRWEKRHVQILVEDVDRAHRGITRIVLACRKRGEEIEACMAEFDNAHTREIAIYRDLLAELAVAEGAPLSGYAIATRVLVGIAG